ncbi:MAG: hypothetical protein WC624_07195 [Candidatus Margulisiibacteriota bacterium]
MKNLFIAVFIFVLSSGSFGQSLIGARAAGMGGTGVATCRDMSAAYYNPAAFIAQDKVGFMGSAGVAYNGTDQLMNLDANVGDPSKWATSNFLKKLKPTGSLNGLIGGNLNKVGLTLLPIFDLRISKPENSLAASGSTSFGYIGLITFGRTFNLQGFPPLNIGANLKYISRAGGSMVTSNFNNAITGFKTISNSCGYGIDIGTLMTFDIPKATSISIGLMARDLFEMINTASSTYNLTAPAASSGNPTFTETKTSDQPLNKMADPDCVLGVAGTVPGIGMLMALDFETNNNIHLGLEWPMPGNLLTLRTGMASGVNLSLTTVGVKIAIPFFTVDTALVMDGKDSMNNQLILDLVGGS